MESRAYVDKRCGYVFKSDVLGDCYYVDDCKTIPPKPKNGQAVSKPTPVALEDTVMPPVRKEHGLAGATRLGARAAHGAPAAKLVTHADTTEWPKPGQMRKGADGKRLRQKKRRANQQSREMLTCFAAPADSSWKNLGYWAIDTFNPNAWASAAGYLETS